MVAAGLRDPGAGVNIEQWIVTIHERVDVAALRSAWDHMVARHDVLRMRLDLTNPAEPRQQVIAAVEGEWVLFDWSDQDSKTIETRWEKFLAHDRHEGFDLRRAPLWRVALLKSGEQEVRLLLTYHHVLLDGRSLTLLGEEFFAAYDRLRTRPASLCVEPPRKSFVDYLTHLSARNKNGDSSAFWRCQLADRSALGPFGARPTERCDDEFATREIIEDLVGEEFDGLCRLAASQNVTLHTLTQAAWGISLAVHTGVDDHTFGSVRACRKTCDDGDRILGMMINTVPFRARIDWRESLSTLVARLRRTQVELRRYELDSPGEIAAALEMDDRRLWSSILMFTDRPIGAMFDVDGRPHATRSTELRERSDSSVNLIVEASRKLTLRLEYDVAALAVADAQLLLKTMRQTLLAFITHNDRPLGELPIIDEKETKALADREHGRRREFSYPSIIARFVAQVQASSDAVALQCGERRWTYAELEAKSAIAAAQLKRRGVVAGDRVVLSLTRSAEWVAGILAVWKLHAVYVPLDPAYPEDRRRAIIDDVAPRLIVVDSPADEDATVIGDLFVSIDGDSLPVASPAADQPAVILFTSGSTGRPKGVVLTHGNLANQNQAVTELTAFTAADRTTTLSSPSFDAALEEVFAPLCVGACLVLPEAAALSSLEHLVALIERERLSVVDMPTSLWRELTHYLYAIDRRYPECVRAIMMGGERVLGETYRRFLSVGGDRIRWFNAYGPTETTICATVHEHNPEIDVALDAPPIGLPIDNVEVRVVDRCGRRVPFGVAGELWIAGAGLALGYWNDEARTAEKFVYASSDAAGEPRRRFYRTGDLVRRREDGVLEFIGRVDSQIKLRGYRIEPAEVETIIAQAPEVSDVVVTIRRSPAGTDVLVAYVVARPGNTIETSSLRTFTTRRLPDYMVPSRFVVVESLPLSPNGKIAVDGLPDPFLAAVELPNFPQRSADEMERWILDVWQTTLGVPQVRLDDDFFSVGGDSLKAMTFAARLETQFSTKLPPNLIHRARTPARIAAELRAGTCLADLAPRVVLRDGDHDQPLFLVHSLGGDAWIYREMLADLPSQSIVYGLQLPGLDGRERPPATLEACAADFVERMRQVQPVGPYRVAGYSSGGLIAFEIAKQLTTDGHVVEFLGLIDSGLPTAVEVWAVQRGGSRLLAFAKNLPTLARELVAMESRQRRRRVVGFLRRLADRLQPRRCDDEELTEREMRECFAEDISVFSPQRLALIREHYRAVEQYAPTPYAGAAHLFRSTRQPVFGSQSRTLGWEHLVQGPLQVTSIFGAHAVLMKRPHATELARALGAALATLEVGQAC